MTEKTYTAEELRYNARCQQQMATSPLILLSTAPAWVMALIGVIAAAMIALAIFSW